MLLLLLLLHFGAATPDQEELYALLDPLNDLALMPPIPPPARSNTPRPGRNLRSTRQSMPAQPSATPLFSPKGSLPLPPNDPPNTIKSNQTRVPGGEPEESGLVFEGVSASERGVLKSVPLAPGSQMSKVTDRICRREPGGRSPRK